MHLEAVIERVWRCTWRPRSSELRDALRGRNQSSLEMHWEAVIEQVWTCTWRPRSSELRDAFPGCDRASWEMPLEAQMEWTHRCTWRPWRIQFGHALGVWDRVHSEMHSEAMIEQAWSSTWRRSNWREARWQLRFYSFVNLKLWECWELSTTTSAERWETSWERETADLGMMLYLVSVVLSVNSWLWHGEIERDDLTLCS